VYTVEEWVGECVCVNPSAWCGMSDEGLEKKKKGGGWLENISISQKFLSVCSRAFVG